MSTLVSVNDNLWLHQPNGSIHCHINNSTICVPDFSIDCYLDCGKNPEHYPSQNYLSEIKKVYLSAKNQNLLFKTNSIDFTQNGDVTLNGIISTDEMKKLIPVARNLSTRKNNFSNLAALYCWLQKNENKNRFLVSGYLEFQMITFLIAAKLLNLIKPRPIRLR